MHKILISLIVGLLFGGMWVQYRITGDIWHNKKIEDIIFEAVKKSNDEQEKWFYDIFNQGNCLIGGKYNNGYRVCPMTLEKGLLKSYKPE